MVEQSLICNIPVTVSVQQHTEKNHCQYFPLINMAFNLCLRVLEYWILNVDTDCTTDSSRKVKTGVPDMSWWWLQRLIPLSGVMSESKPQRSKTKLWQHPDEGPTVPPYHRGHRHSACVLGGGYQFTYQPTPSSGKDAGYRFSPLHHHHAQSVYRPALSQRDCQVNSVSPSW